MDSEFRVSLYGASLIFQDGFAAYMSRYKLAAFDLKEIGKMWIISEFSLRFKGRGPFWGESVDLELWISEKPAVKVYADFRLSSAGRVFAEGYSVWAILDIATRKPQVVTDMLSVVQVENELALGSRRKVIPPSGTLSHEYVHLTNRSDMDFNRHVSNVAYVAASEDALSWDYLGGRRLAGYTAHFLHESFIGDELLCRVFATDGPDVWNVDMSSGGRVCCRVCMEYAPKSR